VEIICTGVRPQQYLRRNVRHDIQPWPFGWERPNLVQSHRRRRRTYF